MRQPRLVINADDLGLAVSVNRGILETIESGLVTSTSLIVNMPACEDAIRRLGYVHSRGAAVSVGLHFNVVQGPAMTPCGTLLDADTGRFSFTSLVAKAFTGRLDERDVQRELDAQLERAERLLEPIGLRVTHIDSHRHVHCIGSLFDIVVRSASSHGIRHVRHPYESRVLLRTPRAVIASLLLRTMLTKAVPPDDVGFTGVAAMASRSFDRDVAAIVGALPGGTTELMVHPGYDSPELAAIDRYRAPRERELRALTSRSLRERILGSGVELTRFGSTAAPA